MINSWAGSTFEQDVHALPDAHPLLEGHLAGSGLAMHGLWMVLSTTWRDALDPTGLCSTIHLPPPGAREPNTNSDMRGGLTRVT